MASFLEEKMVYRRYAALKQIGAILSGKKKFPLTAKGIISMLIIVVQLFGYVLFDTTRAPSGQALDLSDYTLVFEDEFDGDTLNTDIWEYRLPGPRRGGYNSKDMVSVENGNLVIRGEYLEDGEYGAGWYACMLALRQLYRTGYYEIRCICNDDTDFWSAFWISSTSVSPYKAESSKGGTQAVELDIFETTAADSLFPWNRNAVSTSIHCAGVYDDSDKICSRMLGVFRGKNIYKEYNTYGMEWTEDEYIFYINGVETERSSFGLGVCQNSEKLYVTLEIPEKIEKKDLGFKTQFTVDYVRIYEKK